MNTPRTLLLSLAALLITASADASSTIWIKYQDLPRRARETVDKERRHYEVKQVLEMRADGKTTFRVLIDEKGADRAIFVSEGGKLLKEQEVPDVGGVGSGSYEKWIKYNDLPREVRQTLDKERGRHEVRQINFVRRDNREFYRCILDLRGDDLAIRINPAGKLLSFQEVDDVAIGSRETPARTTPASAPCGTTTSPATSAAPSTASATSGPSSRSSSSSATAAGSTAA